MSNPSSRLQPPAMIRWAGIIAIVHSIIGLAYAGLLVYREITGAQDPSLVSENSNIAFVGYGTALFFLIIFGTVLTGAVFMIQGRKWGRGPVAMMEMILVPIAYYMFSAGALWAALATAVTAIAALVFLFHPRSVEWAAARYSL